MSGDEGGTIWLDAESTRVGIVSLDGITPVPGKGWYSPSYGNKVACSVVDYRHEGILTGSSRWTFVMAPAEWLGSAQGVEAISAFQEEIRFKI